MERFEDSDLPYVIRLKQGDVTAFEHLYTVHKFKIAQNLLRLLKSEQLAEDFLHDLFIKIWENRAKIDPGRSFRSYMFRIAGNMAFDFFRAAAKDRRLQERLIANHSGSYMHVEESVIDKERKNLLGAAIQDLPPQCRLVFRLCKIEGRSYQEVSTLLGISPNTINNHLGKAKKKIREKLEKESGMAYLYFAFVLFWF